MTAAERFKIGDRVRSNWTADRFGVVVVNDARDWAKTYLKVQWPHGTSYCLESELDHEQPLEEWN